MEENKKKLIVVDEKGVETEAEVISIFSLDNKEYVLYTLNEIDDNNMVKIYASRLINNGESYSFENIDSDDEWNSVKNEMKRIAKEGKE